MSEKPRWATDPVEFAKKFFNWKAHPGQEKILRSKAQFLTVAAGRRFGKSEAMAVLALYEAFRHPEHIIFIIAPTYDQASVIFETALRFAGRSLFEELVHKTKYSPYPVIIFKHGSEIHARSADKPNNLRGRKAHMVILDEAAFIKDAAVYEVIEPMLADYNGRMIKISTPYGKNHFYESFMKGVEGYEGYESFRFPSYINPYISHEFLEKKKLEYGPTSLRWRVEFEAEFVDDENTVFPWAVIENVVRDYNIPIPPKDDRIYTIGVDVARYHDWTVIIVLDVTEEPWKLVYFERFNQKSWQYVVKRIETVAKRYHAIGYMDATGVGDPIYEAVVEKGVRIKPFKFTAPSKVELMDHLRGKMEAGSIIIPNVREIVDELRYFEFRVTAGGHVRMEAKYGHHDDVVMALALAAYRRPATVSTTKIVLPEKYSWL